MGSLEDGVTTSMQSMSLKDGAFEDTPIFKPLSDRRGYRRIVLPNAMQVLLISDPDTHKGAGSMDVQVGSYCDPEEFPGLAHFLEHMLFFSNEKYPDEGSFRKFIREHGGSENAYTDLEHTNYHFEVSADHFVEALDRFAQFFICPLLEADATSREIKAVDSENGKNLKSDSWRMGQLEKHLTSKDHPYHMFNVGNLETLEVHPKAIGADIRAEMLKFYEAHYSSNLMSLCIYGKETLDELQMLAEEKLTAVKNGKKEVVHFPGQPCSSEHLQILVRAVPITEGHTLKLMWPITPSLQNYREAPSRYISHLIDHKGRGSLLDLFKRLGWANNLWAWEKCITIQEAAFFNVQLELTDVGQDHMAEIVDFIFQYLKILRNEGIAEWIFEEIQALRNMKFHFREKHSPGDYVSGLAGRMRVYPPEDWLAYLLPRKFDFEVLSRAIQQLTPDRVRIFWYSKRFEDVATEVEPWYGTHFSSEKIDQALIKQWRSPEVDTRLHLPDRNPFIPTDFSIVSNDDSKGQFPVILKRTKMSRLWYKSNSEFDTPKACIVMHFHCPESGISPEVSIMAQLFTELLDDYLSVSAYYAVVAGINYRIQATLRGFWISVSGFNHKLISLAMKIMDVFINFAVDNDRFEVMKEMILKRCLNAQFQQPHVQACNNLRLLLQHRGWHVSEFIECIPNLAAEDLRQMFPRMLSRTFIECFVAGNITSKEAEGFLDHVETTLTKGRTVRPKPLFSSQFIEQRTVRLEDGADFNYASLGLNPKNENSALRFYLQIGQDETYMNVLVDLLVLTMDEGVFHQLRTVEQLGYLVGVNSRDDSGVRGVQFCIQSTVKDPESLEGRVEAYLEKFAETLEKLSQEDFKRNVDTLIKLKLEKFKNMWEEINYFLGEIEDNTLIFDRREVEATALQNVDKQALVDFYKRYIQRGAPQRRKLSLQVYGCQHLDEYRAVQEAASAIRKEAIRTEVLQTGEGDDTVREPKEGQEVKLKSRAQLIDDIDSFKRGQSLYSSLWGAFHP